jgi:hypothetical protein
MTSILNLSGLNYGTSNPLRAEMNTIRDYIARVEKNMKELVASGAGGGAITGAKGITAGLKEVALQIVNLRSEVETLKASVTRMELNADTQQKRVDKALADLASRISLSEAAIAATNNTVKAINTTVSSIATGSSAAVQVETADTSNLLSAISEAIAEAEAEGGSEAVVATESSSTEGVTEAPAAVVEANAQEDEAASEEILALLRSS